MSDEVRNTNDNAEGGRPSDLDALSSTKRRGKVARMPLVIRKEINRRLSNGQTYPVIRAWLNGDPEVAAALRDTEEEPFTDQNLSAWYKGGFKEWESRQIQMDEAQATYEKRTAFTIRLAEEGLGDKVAEGSVLKMASQILEVTDEFKLERLKILLDTNPKHYAVLGHLLAKLSDTILDNRKYRDAIEERKRNIAASLDDAKPGNVITKETIDRINRELNLL